LNELFLHGKNGPIHTQMIQQSNSVKIQNRINFLLLCIVFIFWQNKIPHSTKYEPLLNKVVLKQNQSLLEWVEKQSDKLNYMSKIQAKKIQLLKY